MAKTSGGTRSKKTAKGGGLANDGGGTGSKGQFGIKREGSIKEIKNKQLRQDIQQGISKFESRLGVRTVVKLADMKGAYGVHVTSNGKSAGVFLNRSIFKEGTRASITASKQEAYKQKFLNRTNKPTQHTVVHELGHALWTTHFTGAKHKAAAKEITSLYKEFRRKNPKSWGSYGKSNINEFFAEGIAKGVLSKHDRYSRNLFKIVKKHGL